MFGLCTFASVFNHIMLKHEMISNVILSCIGLFNLQGGGLAEAVTSGEIALKSPGNPAVVCPLVEKSGNISIESETAFPLEISKNVETEGDVTKIELTLKASGDAYYNIGQKIETAFGYDDCLFYMPGFWYRRNLRSPKSAPSFHTSDSWTVREDRLSVPLTGIYNKVSGEYYTVLRIDEFKEDALACHSSGEVILSDKTSIGYTGFQNEAGSAVLSFGFPYKETPKSYTRKLTLSPSVQSFEKMEKGDTRTVVWEIRKGTASSYSGFVADVWEYSFSRFNPQPVEVKHTQDQAKAVLSRYFEQSYVGDFPLKYYSGVGLRTKDCASNGKAEIGFVGRVLLNACNALEYGYETGRENLVKDAESVFDSWLAAGFTKGGLFREDVDLKNGNETEVYSIRRQSEGVYAVLLYLAYEKGQGREHPEWETRMKDVLSRLAMLQNEDGSFPRKFNDALEVTDPSGGSTSSAVLPFAMAYRYWGGKDYLKTAEKAASYLENVLIAKADYFSSTLDANCEDKEASLYTATAMYYMSLVEKSKAKKARYTDLCLEASYFALSWYYMWDVPFAQGQMLGDVGFKSRGWGNVSVENNHIDVFIFEFADVLDYLAEYYGKPQFTAFTSVIRSSMLQLMPENGSMFDIGREGYYPEVVQHTNWDYGKNGKGFYNDIFAPGWTVASLWQMLSEGRTEKFFERKY